MIEEIDVNDKRIETFPVWSRFDDNIKETFLKFDRDGVSPDRVIIFAWKRPSNGNIVITNGHVRLNYFRNKFSKGDIKYSKIRIDMSDKMTEVDAYLEHIHSYVVTSRTVYERDDTIYKMLKNVNSPFCNNRKLLMEKFNISAKSLSILEKTFEFRDEYLKNHNTRGVYDNIFNMSNNALYSLITKRRLLTDEIVNIIIWNWKPMGIDVFTNGLLKPLLEMTSLNDRKSFVNAFFSRSSLSKNKEEKNSNGVHEWKDNKEGVCIYASYKDKKTGEIIDVNCKYADIFVWCIHIIGGSWNGLRNMIRKLKKYEISLSDVKKGIDKNNDIDFYHNIEMAERVINNMYVVAKENKNLVVNDSNNFEKVIPSLSYNENDE